MAGERRGRRRDSRALITARGDAVATGDVDAIIADVAEDVAVFDMFGPLHSDGNASVRKRTTSWLDLYETPPRWEDRDVAVAASGVSPSPGKGSGE